MKISQERKKTIQNMFKNGTSLKMLMHFYSIEARDIEKIITEGTKG